MNEPAGPPPLPAPTTDEYAEDWAWLEKREAAALKVIRTAASKPTHFEAATEIARHNGELTLIEALRRRIQTRRKLPRRA